jgi:hypothetical protein
VRIDANSRDNVIASDQISTSRTSGPPLMVQGDHNRLAGNVVSFGASSSIDVPTVQITGRGNELIHNLAQDSPVDGIDIATPGNVLRRNDARDNGRLGVSAVTHTQDGGGNRASGNGDPRQCAGVGCRSPARPQPEPQVITCGSRITRDAVLPADLLCDIDTPAITVAASGVTIDLRGHLVENGFGTVVSAERVDRVTIRNGRLFTEGLAVTASGHGDRFVDLGAMGDIGGISLHDGGDNVIVRGAPGVGIIHQRRGPGGIGLMNESGDRIVDTDDNADLRLTASRNVHATHSRFAEGVSIDPASSRNVIAANTIFTRFFAEPALLVQGDRNRLTGNRTTVIETSGSPDVQIDGSENRLIRDVANDSPADGIDVLAPGNFLRRNVARDNGRLGIQAVPHTRDGGRNRAARDADPRQCVGVRCT